MIEPNPHEHRANERTFLAWVRTSIALIGLGIAIAKSRFLLVASEDMPAHTRRSERVPPC